MQYQRSKYVTTLVNHEISDQESRDDIQGDMQGEIDKTQVACGYLTAYGHSVRSSCWYVG